MPKNYYVILGISPDSTLEDIKAAYRKLAKEYHPDFYSSTSSPFLAIQEAYSVLSDQERRSQYDNSIRDIRVNVKQSRGKDGATTHYEENAEPLIDEHERPEPLSDGPGSTRQSTWSRPVSLQDHFFDTAQEDRFRGNAADNRLPDVEVILSRDQARKGGQVHIHLPTRNRCPQCMGRRISVFYECPRCYGSRYIYGEVPLVLKYPANIRHGHIVEVPLARYGLPNITLTIRFKVSAVL